MPIWLAPILSFLGKRSINFIIYAVIALAIWGLYQKIFGDSQTTKIAHIERQVNVYGQEGQKQDLFNFGCSNLKVDSYWKKRIQGNK